MKNLTIGLALLILVAACSPSSKITSAWKKPKFKGSYSDVVVVALTPSIEAKTNIEDDLVSALNGRNIAASRGMDLFPVNFTKETKKEEMMKRIRRSTSKAIITVSLIHKETSSQYNPGGYGYAPTYTNYGQFWGYYSFWYPAIYSPGYYTQDNVYFMETNVYDVATEALVWSAQSETYNPADVSGFSSELAKMISGKLVKDGILKVKADSQTDKKSLTSFRWPAVLPVLTER